LGQHRVDDLEAALPRPEIVERDEALLALLVEEDGMALRERTAFGILAGQAYRGAFGEQRPEGQRLAGRPVDAGAGFDRLLPGVEEALDGLVDLEVRGNCGELRPDQPQFVER